MHGVHGRIFIEMSFAKSKWRYIRRRWIFLLLSIPALNIINLLNLELDAETVYFLRFIPLARGGLAIAIIVGFLTHNRMASVFASYTAILVLVVYFCSLIIFEREQPVNPQIPDYPTALWFSCMVVTTLGCDISPVTVIGKVLQIVLSAMGTIMFPLFTVFITSTVMRLRQQRAGKAAAQHHAAPHRNSFNSSRPRIRHRAIFISNLTIHPPLSTLVRTNTLESPKPTTTSAIQARDIVISWKMAIFVGLIVYIFSTLLLHLNNHRWNHSS